MAGQLCTGGACGSRAEMHRHWSGSKKLFASHETVIRAETARKEPLSGQRCLEIYLASLARTGGQGNAAQESEAPPRPLAPPLKIGLPPSLRG